MYLHSLSALIISFFKKPHECWTHPLLRCGLKNNFKAYELWFLWNSFKSYLYAAYLYIVQVANNRDRNKIKKNQKPGFYQTWTYWGVCSRKKFLVVSNISKVFRLFAKFWGTWNNVLGRSIMPLLTIPWSSDYIYFILYIL